MHRRPFEPRDQEAVAELHRKMGMDYRMPDLATEGDFVQVIEDARGRVVGASMNRVVAETYAWLDPELDPRDKFTVLRIGQIGMLEEARRRGWRELIAMIPESVARIFTKRLKMLSWTQQRDGWRLWGRNVSGRGAD